MQFMQFSQLQSVAFYFYMFKILNLTLISHLFRASNQSTEAASIAIVKFLEIENFEESSNGWMLLSALNLLAAGDQAIIQVKSKNSLKYTEIFNDQIYFRR